MDGFYVAKFKKMSNTIQKIVKEADEEVSKKRGVEKETLVEFDDEEDEKFIQDSLASQKKRKAHK